MRRYKTNNEFEEDFRHSRRFSKINQLNNMGWKNVDTIIEGKLYLGK